MTTDKPTPTPADAMEAARKLAHCLSSCPDPECSLCGMDEEEIEQIAAALTAYAEGREREARGHFRAAIGDWSYDGEATDDVLCVLLNLGTRLFGLEWSKRAEARSDKLRQERRATAPPAEDT